MSSWLHKLDDEQYEIDNLRKLEHKKGRKRKLEKIIKEKCPEILEYLKLIDELK